MDECDDLEIGIGLCLRLTIRLGPDVMVRRLEGQACRRHPLCALADALHR